MLLGVSLIDFISVEASERFQDSKICIERTEGTTRSPNILLFNCHYGSGHKMATQGITERLPECNIKVVDIYDEPLRSLDPMRDLAPNMSNEKLYNDMAKKERNTLLNFAGKIGPKLFFLQRNNVEELLENFIGKEKPDMIISCVPLVNPMLLTVAKKLEIPLLVITTDIDLSAFCYGFENQDRYKYSKFRITVPFSKVDWFHKFGRRLPESAIDSLQYQFAYPTRLAFSEVFEESILENLRSEYQIQPDENVILVMMGGNTAKAASQYSELLLNMTNEEISRIVGKQNKRDKIRLICLCGDVKQKDNQSLMTQLNALNCSKNKRNNRVYIHACPGTPRIAELASLPELCTVISKPGGSTVNEMIKKKVPMVYHVSRVPLDWERGNMEYGVSRNLGRRFQISGKLNQKTKKSFENALIDTFALHRDIQNGNKQIPEAKFDFTKNLRSTVKEMLSCEDPAHE